MSHKTPSNKSRQRVKLFTLHNQELLTRLQNPSDEEIHEQLISGPVPKNEDDLINWAIMLHHTEKTFMGITGYTGVDFKIQHQELSADGQWECPNKRLTLDEVMQVASSYVDDDDTWRQLVKWVRI